MTQLKPMPLTKGTVIQTDVVVCDYSHAMRFLEWQKEQQEAAYRAAVLAHKLATGEWP